MKLAMKGKIKGKRGLSRQRIDLIDDLLEKKNAWRLEDKGQGLASLEWLSEQDPDIRQNMEKSLSSKEQSLMTKLKFVYCKKLRLVNSSVKISEDMHTNISQNSLQKHNQNNQ